jgi:glycosyltransferase involved in cell wall biosynthesis
MLDPGDFTPAYDLALAEALVSVGHDVRLVGGAGFAEGRRPAFREDWFYRGLALGPAGCLPGTLRRGAKGISHVFDTGRFVARGLEGFAPDVVHWQWLPLPLVDRIFLGLQRANTPVVITVHDSNPYNGAVGGPMRWGFGSAVRAADAVVVHTRQAGDRLIAAGLPSDRVHRVPHGLLHPRTAVEPAVRHAPDCRLRLLQFGKIRPYKGIDVLLAALACLSPAERAGVSLRIVGRPYMDMGPLEAFVHRHGLGATVTFQFDYVADEEIAALLAAADAAVFPYREIDASGAAMTAVAHGVPVLASAIGGFRELFVDGREGRLVPPDDPRSLAAVLRAWIGNPGELRRLRAGMRRRRASIPDWPQIAERTLAVYASAHAVWRAGSGREAAERLRGRRGAVSP